jgi:GWxTD domain-containing protein
MRLHLATACVALLLGMFCASTSVAQCENTAAPDGRPPSTVAACPIVTNLLACFETENQAFESLPTFYRFWLSEDVVFIITTGERCVFLKLTTDEERDQFIEQFWYRRSPNPESFENVFEEEHYRRIVFANGKYGTEIPGWKTDRGRVYITFGPPDSIEQHRSGEMKDAPSATAVEMYEDASEDWHYKYLEGIGADVVLSFVDRTRSGDYQLTLSPEEKDELPSSLAYNLSYSRGAKTPELAQTAVLYVGPQPSPVVQFKDLEAVLTSRLESHQVPLSYHVEFDKATHASTVARIAINLASDHGSAGNESEMPPAELEILLRIIKPSGRIVECFEGRISPGKQHDAERSDPDQEVEAVLESGSYRLEIAVKNGVTGEIGVLRTTLNVPTYDDLDCRTMNADFRCPSFRANDP